MAIKTLPTTHLPLTREVAYRISQLTPAWKGDRNTKKTRMEYLHKQNNSGEFHSPTWAVARCQGQNYRINGKHSSTMLTETDKFPEGLTATILQFECDTEQDVARLYSKFDTRESVRSQTDVTVSFQATHSTLNTVSPTNVRLALDGIVFFQSLDQDCRPDQEERGKMMEEHAAFILWVNPFLVRKLRRAPVIAAMFATYSRDQAFAQEFWSHVKDDTHPNNNNATRVLSKFFNESFIKTIGQTNRTAKWPTIAFYQKAIVAWNAYRRNTTTDLKWYPDSKNPATPI